MKTKVCTCCGVEKAIENFRFKYESKRPKGFYISFCKDCENLKSREYQKQNLDKYREYNQRAYLKKHGPIKRNMHHTEETRAQWKREKAYKRATRAKQARVLWDKELTDFVYTEAHKLRKLRNEQTGFEWHVDHVIPLKGKEVCGLHVWNNFAVIPKVENLRKGNYHPIHVEWKKRL